VKKAFESLLDLQDPYTWFDWIVILLCLTVIFVVVPYGIYEMWADPLVLPHIVGGTGDHLAGH
jgi:hypothetical protein